MVVYTGYVETAEECVLTQAQDFRRGALAVCEQAVMERTQSESTAMRYYYPPNLLDYQPRVDQEDSEISVSVDYLSSDATRYGTIIRVLALCSCWWFIVCMCAG